MAHKLPSNYLNLIFSCENASIIGSVDAEKIEYEPCCECVPCRTIIASNYYEKGYFPENYSKNLKRHYARQLERLSCKVVNYDGKTINYWGEEIEVVEDKLDACEKKFEPYQLTIPFPPDLSVFKSPGVCYKEKDS